MSTENYQHNVGTREAEKSRTKTNQQQGPPWDA
jgi:hypothetical protein